MSDKKTVIRRAIETIGGSGEYEILSGNVEKVDEANYQVDIRINGDDDNDSLVLPSIMLRAASDGTKAGMVMIPKVGSNVIFCKVEGASDYVLLNTSELDKTITEIATTKLTITGDGYEIKRGDETLLKVLVDFMAEVQKVIVINGRTPDIEAIEAIKTRMKTLLK